MDLTPAPGFKKRAAASSSRRKVGEITRSPPPCSPSLSLSSPSSDPSSPLSTSSSVGASSSVYQKHVKGQTQQTEVSSTSVSQAAQSLSTAKPNTICMDFCLHTLIQPSQDCEEKDKKGEMYDPFHPTEGDKEVRMKGEGGEGEKYDPFDPTGSPASDTYNGSDKVGGGENVDERGDEKEEEYPDSTDTLTDLLSPCLVAKLPLGSKVDCSTIKPGGQSADSDHSEIEEGEIVGAAERNQSSKRAEREILPLNSPTISFFGPKPERILRVLDGDGFVSLCAEGSWEMDREPEEEPVVGVEDLRRKLVSRRKERYLSFPTSSPLSPQPPPPSSHLPASTSSSPLTPPTEQDSKKHKSSKSSKDREGLKSKDRKAGEKEERRKKKRKEKVGGEERSKEKEQGHKTGKEVKGLRSSSHKRKKRQHNSPETLRSCNLDRGGDIRHSLSSLSQEIHQERFKDKEGDIDKDMDRNTKQGRGRERHKEREQNRTSSHRRDERDRDCSSRKERERKEIHNSSSRERCISKRSKRSREKKEGDRDRQRERDWLRDGRPVVPPSIQDLNGSDLFAIKRTITVTTTTTTTTVPGSPRLAPTSPCWPKQDPDKPHKRKKKRKWHSTGEVEDRGCCRSRSRSFSPPKYRSFESDRYSEKFEIDVLSLDGEALDSDYPSLEDTPPAALVPEPPVLSPKTKITLKTERHHQGKKSRTLKKIGQPKSSFSSRIKNKCLSSLMVTSGSPSVSSGLPSAKQAKKLGKDKDRDKCSRKDLGRSGKSNKESGGSRKGKLQSKVSVLVREGVSSTTGTSVGSGKLGMDLLGPGVTGGGSGGSVVGGSIAVVFCRDNESRSPFLKPCSELPSLSGRSKDLSSMGKRNSLAATPASLSSSAGLKSKKTKPSSITSTSSSSASSPSSLVTKHCRRLAKKTRDKGGAAVLTAACSQANTTAEGWGGASLDVQSAVGNGNKSVSPHTDQVGLPPCSSSSSSTSVLPPSSSPQQTPPLSLAPLQDTGGSSPDSQTVDSSCKTPDPSFLADNCPTQTSPTLPTSSPPSLSAPQGAGLSITLSTPMAKPPPLDDAPNTLVSPSCSSSSAGCGLTSLSLPLSSSDPSSSSVSSSSANKPPLPPPPAAHALPWSLQTGVDCTTGGVLALTALLFKMEEANIASRAKAQEFIQATNQILSQANQSQSQQHGPPSSAAASSQIPPPPSVPPPPELSPAQFILHSSLPLVGCSKTPPSHLHPSGGGCIQTPPSIMPLGLSGVTGTSSDTGWDNGSKDPDKYLKKLHTQERAVEEVKLAIKPYYQRKDINKDEYKDILRKAVHKTSLFRPLV